MLLKDQSGSGWPSANQNDENLQIFCHAINEDYCQTIDLRWLVCLGVHASEC